HRLLAEGALWAEVGDADFLLERPARGNDLAEYAARIVGHAPQNFALALGPVSRRLSLQPAYLARDAHAALEQREQLVVERIDLRAQRCEGFPLRTLVAHVPGLSLY